MKKNVFYWFLFLSCFEKDFEIYKNWGAVWLGGGGGGEEEGGRAAVIEIPEVAMSLIEYLIKVNW